MNSGQTGVLGAHGVTGSRWDLQETHVQEKNVLLVPLGSAPLTPEASPAAFESSFSFPTSRVGVLRPPFPCPVPPAPESCSSSCASFRPFSLRHLASCSLFEGLC